jgi:hypothetical protein
MFGLSSLFSNTPKRKFQNVAPRALSNADADRMNSLMMEYASGNKSVLDEFRFLEKKYGWASLPEEQIQRNGAYMLRRPKPQPQTIYETRAASPVSPINLSRNLESPQTTENRPVSWSTVIPVNAPPTFLRKPYATRPGTRNIVHGGRKSRKSRKSRRFNKLRKSRKNKV